MEKNFFPTISEKKKCFPKIKKSKNPKKSKMVLGYINHKLELLNLLQPRYASKPGTFKRVTEKNYTPAMKQIVNRRGKLQSRSRDSRITPHSRFDSRSYEREFERLLAENNYQEIINNVINHGLKLSTRQAHRVWASVFNDPTSKSVIEVRGLGFKKYFPVNEVARDIVLYLLTEKTPNLEDGNDMVLPSLIKYEDSEYFGGSNMLIEVVFNDIREIKISTLKPKRTIENRDAGFFPFVNTTQLDLSRYQIYNQIQAYDDCTVGEREHCLIHTLEQQGICKATVNAIKLSYVAGTNIAKKDLHNISNFIKRNINVHTQNAHRIKIQKIQADEVEKDKEDINIALYKNHFFTFENTEYSKYSITHYDDLENEEDFGNITRMYEVKGKTYFKREENKSKVNSLLLVIKFFEQGKFEKLDLTKFEETSSHKEIRNHIYLDNIHNEQRLYKVKKKGEEESEGGQVGEGSEDVEQSEGGPGGEESEESEGSEGSEGNRMGKGKRVGRNRVKTRKKRKKRSIYFADTEALVNDPERHRLYLLGFVDLDSDNVSIFNIKDDMFNPKKEVTREQLLVYKWLYYMTNDGERDVLVYFHNLKYDYHILEKYLNIRSRCEKDGQLYSVTCMYKGCLIELRDSYKMIPFSLSKFCKEFGLPKDMCKKEAIAYEYYNGENDNQRCKIREYRQFLSSKEKTIFNKTVKECSSYNEVDKTFNPTTYYKDYLRLDCLVLKKGVQKFNEVIMGITEGKMTVYDSLTISSLTDKYLAIEGAFEGIYEVQGNLREYISQAVYGGRVYPNEKYKKKVIRGKIADFDATSLYPSAIRRLCENRGLPKGRAKRLPKDENWRDKNYAIMTVKIHKVNKKQQMPFIAQHTESGIDYSNTPPEKPIIIDCITLEDYEKFHQIEYEILDGIYWDEGVNKKMGVVIQRLFNARLQAKKEGKNSLSKTIKLMLNSAYGKTITKKVKCEKVIVKTHRYRKVGDKWVKEERANIDNFIYNNFNTIKQYRELNDQCYEVERLKADHSYNRGHIGVAILSTSKRIMNEVFDLANTEKIPIYYTDTDSIHCNLSDVNRLNLAYHIRYKKQLIGEELGQFHTDFELDGAVGEIYATQSIFLGKKSYLDCLEGRDKDGNIITGFHSKLKGITKQGLEAEAKKYENSYLGLYEDLAKGEEKTILLNPFNEEENEKKVMFGYKEGKVFTRSEFTRTVKF